jgi:hypothetical protein
LIYDHIENRGRHTHRGSHSSYDSRRKYLSDAYLEKSSILEERAQRHNSRGAMVRGSMSNVSALHQIDIPCSKGERLFSGNKIGGASPRRVQARGAAPRGEWPFSIDVKGGEMVTLM